MLYEKMLELYNRSRLAQYRRLFGRIKERPGSLSATEGYALDVIYLLGEPTMKQFADFLGISQPNATYKINALIAKGYVDRVHSHTDGREYRLVVQDKFYQYYSDSSSFLHKAAAKLESELSPEELAVLAKAINALQSLEFSSGAKGEHHGSF